jgi:hypothetical protein
LLFIVTFITSIGTPALFEPVLADPAGQRRQGHADVLRRLPGAAARDVERGHGYSPIVRPNWRGDAGGPEAQRA